MEVTAGRVPSVKITVPSAEHSFDAKLTVVTRRTYGHITRNTSKLANIGSESSGRLPLREVYTCTVDKEEQSPGSAPTNTSTIDDHRTETTRALSDCRDYVIPDSQATEEDPSLSVPLERQVDVSFDGPESCSLFAPPREGGTYAVDGGAPERAASMLAEEAMFRTRKRKLDQK